MRLGVTTMSLDLLQLLSNAGPKVVTEPLEAVRERAAASSSSPSGSDFGAAVQTALVCEGTNKADIYCPREGCGVKVLRRGAAQYVCRPSGPLLHAHAQLPLELGAGSPAEEGTYWMVTSPLSFENVGFSKDVALEEGASKYLICGACDVGPLGYVLLPQKMQGGGLAQSVSETIDAHQGGQAPDIAPAEAVGHPNTPKQELLVAVDRVRYAVA